MKSFMMAIFIIFGLLAMANAVISIVEVRSVIHQIYISISIMIGLLAWILAAILDIDLNVEIKDADVDDEDEEIEKVVEEKEVVENEEKEVVEISKKSWYKY